MKPSRPASSFPLFLLIASLALAVIPAGAAFSSEGSGVRWQSGSNLYVAGGSVTVDEDVDGDLRVTGDTVILDRRTAVDGNAWIAGRKVVIEGDVDGDLDVRGQDVLINGAVDGNVSSYSATLALGPDARIDGNLVYFAPRAADIDASARVSGEIEAHHFDEAGDRAGDRARDGAGGRDAERRDAWRGHEGMRDRHRHRDVSLFPAMLLLGLIAAVTALIAPRPVDAAGRAFAAEPALGLGFGLAWFIGVPLIAALFAIIIVGLPVAFLLVMLYPLGIPLGAVMGVLLIGHWLLDRLRVDMASNTARQIAAVVLGTLLFWLAISLPWIGAIAGLAVLAAGFGAVALAVRNRLLGPPHPAE